MKKPSLLFVTDLYYKANNRTYYEEDLYLTSQLKIDFDILICNPLHSYPFEGLADLVVIRNSGPTIYYKEYFDNFFKRVNSNNIPTFNSMDGQGDMLGKEYLLVFTKSNFAVIPTFDNTKEALEYTSEFYIVKPKQGADSIGARKVTREELLSTKLADEIVQPFIDFEYEVSFYFINTTFQYALFAPNKKERWKLENYKPTAEDLAFANKFVEWNTMSYGIQRVDACRTKEGKLLLVELEDLNPYLSLDLLNEQNRSAFIHNFKLALLTVIEKNSDRVSSIK